MALCTQGADPVHKATIVPRGEVGWVGGRGEGEGLLVLARHAVMALWTQGVDPVHHAMFVIQDEQGEIGQQGMRPGHG